MRKCKPSWLDSYIEYTSEQESPKAFHHWVGISIVGAVLGRNIHIPRIKYTTYPNLFVILVAGSAKCRKSVSLSIGKDLLHALKEPPAIFAQKITTEALIQALEEAKKNDCCYGIICASELSVFLGSDAIKSGIIPALTDLYDSPKDWVYHTRGRGKESLRNVTLSMIAASTKDWLRASIPAEAIGGGFTSRVIFVFEDEPSKLILFPKPENDSGNEELKKRLVHDLEEMKKLYGPIQFSDDARKLAWEWYQDESSKLHDEKTDGYFGRKHDTMFKVATILSVAEGDSLIVEKNHVQRALDLLERNEQFLNSVMESVVSTSFGGNTDKIFHIIKKYRDISHVDLLQKVWRYSTATEMAEIMRTLVDSGEVTEYLDKANNKRYKRKEDKVK